MRRLRLLAAVGVLLAVVVSATTAGAATPKAQPHTSSVRVHKLDLSSMAKIHRYLRSIGVDPKTVVIQRGKRNYAGPHCPGKGWTCTKSTRVLQVGSDNTYECTGTGSGMSGGTQTCDGGMQNGTNNTFRCIEKTSVNPAVQACSVQQTGNSNYALIEQVADINSSTDITAQSASQTADVDQTAHAGTGPPKNELHVFQRVYESISAPGDQMQDGGQGVRYTQSADNPGNNYSDINQYLDETASGAATSQKQDTGAVSTGDCASSGPPASPNQCVDGLQTGGPNGKNESHLHQLIDEDAKTSVPTAHQTQGNPDGGNAGDIHQDIEGIDGGLTPINTSGTGQSTDHSDQARRQSVAGGSVEVQDDPTRCCGTSQQGGTNNNEDINQFAGQKSDNHASQHLTLIGECNTDPGTCTAAQHAKDDGANSNFSASCGSNSAVACPIIVTTDCTSGPETTGACTTETSEPDELATLDDGIFTAANALPGVPLPGFEITMGLIDPLTTVPSGLP